MKRIVWPGLLAAILLAACSPAPQPTAAPTLAPTPAPLPSATPTAVPPRVLTLCLAGEPPSLFPLGAGESAQAVLEAIYESPVDHTPAGLQPVLLEQLPSLESGTAELRPVEVTLGDTVVDALGNVNTLASGVSVYPAGCVQSSCSVTYDGTSPLQMDQLVVRYTLKDGIRWSDGEPVTAADSVFAYQLAADPAVQAERALVERSASYTALDERTVEWVARPGYRDHQYAERFWTPLPSHLWQGRPAAELAQAEEVTRRPVGYGPYTIQEWTPGQQLTLARSETYFRAGEGLPAFDQLVFRFVGQNAGGNLEAVEAGQCDLVLPSGLAQEPIADALAMINQRGLQAFAYRDGAWEHLDFGIRPASYDDGYNPAVDRMDFFGDARTRQAVALCIDRTALASQLVGGLAPAPAAYLPADDPLAAADLPVYAFDPAAGAALLDEVGWKDSDGDPATPRTASGVRNIPDGTPFQVTYHTTDAGLRQQTAQVAADQLTGCGIGVTVQAQPLGEVFAPGPQGPVFGRAFDLAQFRWEAVPQPACWLYESARVPTALNQWIGVNVSGFASPEYDAACQAALQTLPGQPGYLEAQHEAQRAFAEALPAVPLLEIPRLLAARPDLCGYQPAPGGGVLESLERIQTGPECPHE